MKTGTLINRLMFTLIGFSLTVLFIDAAGQSLTVNDIPDQTITVGQTFSIVNLDNFIDVPSSELPSIEWSATGASQLSVNIDNGHNASIITPSDTWDRFRNHNFSCHRY